MNLKTEPLSKGDTERLVRWLMDPGADVFVKVIESEAFDCEVAAVEHLAIDTEGGRKAAESDIEMARKIRYVLVLLKRMKGETTFKTATASPTRFK